MLAWHAQGTPSTVHKSQTGVSMYALLVLQGYPCKLHGRSTNPPIGMKKKR